MSRTNKNLITHGLLVGKGKPPKIYITWTMMKQRCLNKNYKNYKNYGGRGVTVCERWKKFDNFYNDMYESFVIHLEEYGKSNTTIERINNNGNYELNNCKWVTRKQQANNRRTNVYIEIENKIYRPRDIKKEFNISYTCLCQRNQKEYNLNKAVRIKKFINSKTNEKYLGFNSWKEISSFLGISRQRCFQLFNKGNTFVDLLKRYCEINYLESK